MLIDLQDIEKTYRLGEVEVPALRGVSEQVERGEFIAIMGHSGSGKTTLMNILGLLDRPTGGRYRLDGDDVTRMTEDQLARIRNRKIGFVFQSYNLLARTSAIENVELPLIYNGGGRSKPGRARELLELVGLGDRVHHHPGQLSGGEQQRVAIARALINDPPLILADEPTGNLDSRSSQEIMALFQQLHGQGITIVMVTHEDDIAAYAQRVITIRDGRKL